MARINPAAVQLITQVTQRNPKVTAKAVDAPDGFNIHRSIEFDARTSKWLIPALEIIDDERIDFIEWEGKGKSVITFVGDARADHRYPEFPLNEVLAAQEGWDQK